MCKIGFRDIVTSAGSGLINQTLTPASQNISSLMSYSVWDRQENYTNVTGLPSSEIGRRLGSKVVRYTLNQLPTFNTGISAGAMDKGWLDVDYAPGAAPNTGSFWCPFLFFACNG